MDDFSQIIGFIVAAAFFIGSAIRKKNKKNPSPKTSSKLTDALESFLGGELEPNPENELIQSHSEETITHVEPTSNPIPGSQFKKAQSSIANEKIKYVSSFKKEPAHANPKSKKQLKKQRSFNLKQAIIYSEILNPKKF